MPTFNPISSSLFFSRQDKRDPRLGEVAQPSTLDTLPAESAFILAGYPDDEGISLNGGRFGAAQAPDRIRSFLYKMTPSLHGTPARPVFDIGNHSLDMPLDQRHESVRRSLKGALSLGHKWIGLGGGHDYGYADGAGFLDQFIGSPTRPLVINFDAHLDVRTTEKGLNSGTPFYRLLNQYEDFDLLQIGIQPQCNSRQHWQFCVEKGGQILSWSEIETSAQSPNISCARFLENAWLKKRPTFLSLDIDCFSSAYAPGCSQSFATGFEPRDFFPLFEQVVRRLDVRVLGIYEVSPPLDQDDRTSKLAAQIIHRFLHI